MVLHNNTDGTSRTWNLGFGFLLIKLSEAVLELDQDLKPKEGSDGDIRESELVAIDEPSFLDWRETILDYAESSKEASYGSAPMARSLRLGLMLLAIHTQRSIGL